MKYCTKSNRVLFHVIHEGKRVTVLTFCQWQMFFAHRLFKINVESTISYRIWQQNFVQQNFSGLVELNISQTKDP